MYYSIAKFTHTFQAVKAFEKLIESKSLVLILRNKHVGFITFTSNTPQP